MRQRQLDIQRARFDKAANIGRIIIETALAVVHQLGSGDPYTAIARAIGAGVIGAAQLAVAAAQPVPKFKGGRKDGPATFAIVGDGGRNEVITSPDLSKSYVTPDRDTLTYLPEGYKVFPSVEDFQKKAAAMSYRPVKATNEKVFDETRLAEAIIKGNAQGNKDLIQAVQNKKELHIHGTHSGVIMLHKYAQTQFQYLNQLINF
jgi:hypothetical protein